MAVVAITHFTNPILVLSMFTAYYQSNLYCFIFITALVCRGVLEQGSVHYCIMGLMPVPLDKHGLEGILTGM